MSVATELQTTTHPGLHSYLLEHVLPRHFVPGGRAVDLGTGSGAFAVRLREAGWDALAVDVNGEGYKADLPFLHVNLNQPDFASQLGLRAFDLVTSIEVLEHVESPIGFLRNVGHMLKPGGVAVLSTPNVDCTPARLKFLLTGTIRMMDANSESTHISPIFWDLFTRQFLPRAALKLLEHSVYPLHGYDMTRSGLAQVMRIVSLFLRGKCLEGDNHILTLQASKPSG